MGKYNEEQFQIIAQDQQYGFMLFKPDSVQKDLVDTLLPLTLVNLNNNFGCVEIDAMCTLGPIQSYEELSLIYPELASPFLAANLTLFGEDVSVAVLFRGEGLDMDTVLKKVKGKVRKDTGTGGFSDGIRAILPTIGEMESFLALRKVIESNIPLSPSNYYSLVRNLVHTPDSYIERLGILKLMSRYNAFEE